VNNDIFERFLQKNNARFKNKNMSSSSESEESDTGIFEENNLSDLESESKWIIEDELEKVNGNTW